MDKAQALHEFWSSFQWQAVDEQSMYDDSTMENLNIDFPFIAYEVMTSNFNNEVMLTANLFDSSTSWDRITWKADEIAEAIGMGGKLIPIDGGAIWLKLGSPFATRMPDDSNKDNIRRIYLNVTAEFITAV